MQSSGRLPPSLDPPMGTTRCQKRTKISFCQYLVGDIREASLADERLESVQLKKTNG